MEEATREFDAATDPEGFDAEEEPTAEEHPVLREHEDEAMTIMSELRAKREAIGADRTLDLEIPGYKGMLRARYKRIELNETMKAALRIVDARGSEERIRGIINAQIDLLVRACEEVLVRPNGSTEYIPLNEAVPQFGDAPVRYDERLAAITGYDGEVRTARQALRIVFKNEQTIPAHANEVTQWMQDTREVDDEDFGES